MDNRMLLVTRACCCFRALPWFLRTLTPSRRITSVCGETADTRTRFLREPGLHLALRSAEQLGEESDQLLVRSSFDRRRGQSDLQCIAERADHLTSLRAWLGMHQQHQPIRLQLQPMGLVVLRCS